MFDSRTLKVGDKILLAYDHKGGTNPPDRIVRINHTDDEGFMYDIEKVLVMLPSGISVMAPISIARGMGMRIRGGRRIWHHDFAVNMAVRSKRI